MRFWTSRTRFDKDFWHMWSLMDIMVLHYTSFMDWDTFLQIQMYAIL
ncbi:hypothetical protein CIY_14660 [Butyrivibrio fibrisolvens 16/4]|nr:hypothetical protein CIY_14660 [Butyrivibrio fibrisolvens 16/4]